MSQDQNRTTTDDWVTQKARELVARWEHGDETHRQWLRDIAIPDITEALREMMPIRYKDRPPGFVEERKKHCTTPHLCFEFGDAAPVCPPCDRATFNALQEKARA